jgi:glycosyltransferase involved in cell wall biosynthesis
MSFPRILIFGQPFNNFSGGGITLTNLFKGWPREKIAVAFIGHGLLNVTADVCNTYYQLGKEEHKWLFPLNLIQRKFASGLRIVDSSTIMIPPNYIQSGFRYKTVNKIFYPFLKWLGLFHALSKICLSERFKNWLNEFQPEILYIQASTRETILFSRELSDFLKIPSVIHVMDDWPSTISTKGLLKNYWNGKIDYEFRELLDSVDLHLSISEEMSAEYFNRYNKKFIPFHNPIESEIWLKHSNTDYKINRDDITLLYSGRLGDYGVTESIIEVAAAIEQMKEESFKIKLHIQTPSRKKEILDELRKFNCVVINEFVEYEKLPEVLANADILLLPCDFSEQGIKYLRLSMPTKASEYMISGTPVMVYAPAETAVYQFFMRNKCGICVTSQYQADVQRALKNIIENEEYRRDISINATRLAMEKFDARSVRSRFQKTLVSLVKK